MLNTISIDDNTAFVIVQYTVENISKSRSQLRNKSEYPLLKQNASFGYESFPEEDDKLHVETSQDSSHSTVFQEIGSKVNENIDNNLKPLEHESIPEYDLPFEDEYPCTDFPLHAGDKVLLNPVGPSMSFGNRMQNMYFLAKVLARIEQRYHVNFILLHRALQGQLLSERILPWVSSFDVSISVEHAKILEEYIKSLLPLESSKKFIQFYWDDHTDALWYIDTLEVHHIEYRVYSGCETQDKEKLVRIEAEDECSRNYVDITVLYPSSRDKVKSMVDATHPKNFPVPLDDHVLHTKALEVSFTRPDMRNMASSAHVYNVRTIYPIKSCLFNGVHLSCPSRGAIAVTQEYGDSSLTGEFLKWHLNESRCWVLRPEETLLEPTDHKNDMETVYPCMDFPIHGDGIAFHSHRSKFTNFSFELQMKSLYELTRILVATERLLDIHFVLLHGSLLGQALSSRGLPWDDDIDVSIELEESHRLRKYIQNLQFIGKTFMNISFYLDNQTDHLWYIDDAEVHHIEYRLYSGCNTTDPEILMQIELVNVCPRTYVDITVLYPSTRSEFLPKLEHIADMVRRPREFSENLLYYKAIDIAYRFPANRGIARAAHIYNYETLYPLQKCLFNGVRMWCPGNMSSAIFQEFKPTALEPSYKGLLLNQSGCWVNPNISQHEETKAPTSAPIKKPKREYRFLPPESLPFTKEGEKAYPCMDFPLYLADASMGNMAGHPGNSALPFEKRVEFLYLLSRMLHEVAKQLQINFILLHGSLIGQALSGRILPWDDDIDVSISLEHAQLLEEYIRSLQYIGSISKVQTSFYLNNYTDILWYIDKHSRHHIEYRMYSGCNTTDRHRLMKIGEENGCQRAYVDITVLYPSTRQEIQPKLNFTDPRRRRPETLSDKVYYYKALDMAYETQDLSIAAGAHIYNEETLYPLKTCLFNGVYLSCPANTVDALIQEYKETVFRRSYLRFELNATGCWIVKRLSQLRREVLVSPPLYQNDVVH